MFGHSKFIYSDAKYSHAAVWPLVPGFDKTDANGEAKRNYPVAAMVANVRILPYFRNVKLTDNVACKADTR